jgi:hypothetical protein
MEVPSILLSSGVIARPGISPIMVASRIISRQEEAGAPFGPLKDGSRNVAEAMERIRVEEIVKALQEDSQIQIVIPPGGIMVQTNGANAGGPVVSLGSNTNYVSGMGIIK